MDVEAWMEKAVRSATGDQSAVIVAASKKDASLPGDNFMSHVSLFSIDCVGSNGYFTSKLFVKAAEETPFTSKGFDQKKFFKIEKLMYEVVLPRLQLQISRPKHYVMTDTLFVFEDMKDKGFAMANRREGLNDNQLAHALQEIAKMHASSISLRVHCPLEYENMLSMIGNRIEEQKRIKDLIRKSIHGVSKLLRGKGMKDHEKLLQDVPLTSFLESCKAQPSDPLRAITHGDFWTNNLLFNNDQVCVVDFQNCCEASLVRDVLPFIFNSSRPGSSVTTWLKVYFVELERYCKQLNVSVPNWVEFCEYVAERADYGFLCGILYLGARVMTPQLAKSLEQNIKDGTPEDELVQLFNSDDAYYYYLINLIRMYHETKVFF